MYGQLRKENSQLLGTEVLRRDATSSQIQPGPPRLEEREAVAPRPDDVATRQEEVGEQGEGTREQEALNESGPEPWTRYLPR